MSFQRLFRAGMCTLCALIFVLNSRGPQHAAAESAEEPSPTPRPSAASVSAAYRRLSAGKPDLDVEAWPLRLYGSGRPVTEEPAETVRVGGVPVDARIADELRAMIAAARTAGLRVYLSCGYTDAAAQTHIYRRTAAKYGAETAQTIVGLPAENEHRSGLAVDIADRYYEEKDSGLENTELFELSAVGCFHDNESFAALVAAHPELERLDIPWNDGLTDLTPVLSLEHLQYLKVSENMSPSLEPVQAATPAFEIEVQS